MTTENALSAASKKPRGLAGPANKGSGLSKPRKGFGLPGRPKGPGLRHPKKGHGLSRPKQHGLAMPKTAEHRYSLIVEWSDEDQAWVGRCPELMFGGVHGDDRAKVYAELCESVDEHIRIAQEDGTALPEALAGKEFSGKFVLRTTPDHHRLLALRALQAGDSLNNYVVNRLK